MLRELRLFYLDSLKVKKYLGAQTKNKMTYAPFILCFARRHIFFA